MSDCTEDRLRQPQADLEHAELSLREGDYAWACFAAHQAAEKSLKALYLHRHGDPWNHSLLTLLQNLPAPIRKDLSDSLIDSARALDKHYIQTRYPNGFPSEGILLYP